jgi:predicted nucleotidyltransferase
VTQVVNSPLQRDEALSRLRALEPELRARGLRSLFLYGSVARNEAEATSDVDLFCDLEPAARLGWRFFGLGPWLGQQLGREVQLGTRGALHDMLRERIERSAVQVF